MLEVGPAVKVTVHLNDDVNAQDDFLHNVLLKFLYENDVSGATVFLPHAGFGVHHRVHMHGGAWSGGEHLPVRIEFIESKSKVEEIMPQLWNLVTDGMIDAHETTILKIVKKGQDDGKGSPPAR